MTLVSVTPGITLLADRPSTQINRLSIAVIDGLSLSFNGTPIVLPNRKARALVAYLALGGERSFSRERLAGLLWSESDETRARSSLRTTLHELRKALLPHGCLALRIGQEEVSLAHEWIEVDLEHALTEIAAGRLPENLEERPRTVGMLLAGYEDLTEEYRGWVEQLRASAQTRVSRALQQGYESQSLTSHQRRALAEAALRIDPLNEAACRVLMRLAAESGEIGVALRAYAALYDALGVELDMEPSEPTQALVAEIKCGRIEAQNQASGPVTPAASPAVETTIGEATIIVLPFAVSEGSDIAVSAGQFAEGLAEGIVHVLSGIGELFVIARGTARAFAGRVVDPREVRRELGVDYVLSGHVSATDRLRVFTELAEAASGRVIRTGRYESQPQGIFSLQDRIADEVVALIAPAVKEHALARARRKPPGTLSAYDLMLQGTEMQYALDEASYMKAGELLYEAIALDPAFAPPYAHAATWHNFRIGQGWSPDPGDDAIHAARCAARALELDRNNAVALAIQGQTLSFNGRNYDAARQYLDRAIEMGPSSLIAWTLSSATYSWTGNGTLGAEHASRAIRLSPFDPFIFFAEHMLSQSSYMKGDYEAAIRLARQVAQRNPRLTSNLRTLAASLVATGAIEAAREAATQMLAFEPNFRLSAFDRRTPLCDAVRGGYIAQLRLAGLRDD
jgi:DNA-binding SARP family transcriptional activator